MSGVARWAQHGGVRPWISFPGPDMTIANSESVDCSAQVLKRRANRYRSRARFRTAILFHLGKMNLYPICGRPLETQSPLLL